MPAERRLHGVLGRDLGGVAPALQEAVQLQGLHLVTASCRGSGGEQLLDERHAGGARRRSASMRSMRSASSPTRSASSWRRSSRRRRPPPAPPGAGPPAASSRAACGPGSPPAPRPAAPRPRCCGRSARIPCDAWSSPSWTTWCTSRSATRLTIVIGAPTTGSTVADVGTQPHRRVRRPACRRTPGGRGRTAPTAASRRRGRARG